MLHLLLDMFHVARVDHSPRIRTHPRYAATLLVLAAPISLIVQMSGVVRFMSALSAGEEAVFFGASAAKAV